MATTVSFPLVLAMLGGLAIAHAPLQSQPLFDIQIHLQIDRSIAPKVRLADLENEVEQIWRPYGVRLTWPDCRSLTEPFPLTAVLLWQMERSGVPDGPTVLGRAVVEASDPPKRPIRVSVEAIEQALARRPHPWTSIAGQLYQRELARALGRVLAHEIGHVLLALRSHEQTGLMREIFTPEELARADRSSFALTPNTVGRLRSRIEVLSQ